VSIHQNLDYFFMCPMCHVEIPVRLAGDVEGYPPEVLLSVECKNCNWGGDLPAVDLRSSSA